MNFLESIFLGIIQGITEFLPVSSSGHLAIIQNLMGIQTDNRMFFYVLLHFSTLIAIIAALWKDIKRLFIEIIRIIIDICRNIKIFINNMKTARNEAYKKVICNNYRKLAVMIIVATVPTTMLGFVSRHLIEVAEANLLAPAIGLLITGVLLLVVNYIKLGDKIPKDATYADSMWVGICQGLSVFPGVSRAGVTIVSGLLCGFGRKFAVKFSFLMSIPTIVGAMILECASLEENTISTSQIGHYLLGAVVSAVVGFFVVRLMIRIVQRKQLCYFSYYCFAVGLAAIICNFVQGK